MEWRCSIRALKGETERSSTRSDWMRGKEDGEVPDKGMIAKCRMDREGGMEGWREGGMAGWWDGGMGIGSTMDTHKKAACPHSLPFFSLSPVSNGKCTDGLASSPNLSQSADLTFGAGLRPNSFSVHVLHPTFPFSKPTNIPPSSHSHSSFFLPIPTLCQASNLSSFLPS